MATTNIKSISLTEQNYIRVLLLWLVVLIASGIYMVLYISIYPIQVKATMQAPLLLSWIDNFNQEFIMDSILLGIIFFTCILMGITKLNNLFSQERDCPITFSSFDKLIGNLIIWNFLIFFSDVIFSTRLTARPEIYMNLVIGIIYLNNLTKKSPEGVKEKLRWINYSTYSVGGLGVILSISSIYFYFNLFSNQQLNIIYLCLGIAIISLGLVLKFKLQIKWSYEQHF